MIRTILENKTSLFHTENCIVFKYFDAFRMMYFYSNKISTSHQFVQSVLIASHKKPNIK